MQIVRTVVWVLLLVLLALFTFANWVPVTLRVWDGVLVDTMLPAVVLLAFAAGFVPMWLLYRGSKWQWRRRVAALEAAQRAALTPAPAPPPPAIPAAEDDTALPIPQQPVQP